ncbi:MAG TPA: magnesium and cobalt transport protein CorA [Firmicutes bacterium]|jgi:magnesium transporter|nr:magnesium and cobalt transport protein CorA [Bacillota bacterium]
MHKYGKQYSLKAGMPPGTLIHVGVRKKDKIQITEFNYSEDGFEEKEIDGPALCSLDIGKPSVIQWINVDGIHDVGALETLGGCFGLHLLVMEDILNTEQRPKIENFNEYTFMVVKSLSFDRQMGEFTTEQVSLILGKHFVLSFSEKEDNLFNPVRERIKHGIGRIRKSGPDYLIYSLLDIIIDNYFVVLEELGEKIEYAEDELISKTSLDTLQVIHKLKRQMLFLHKSVWPLREVIVSLEREETPLISESMDIYLRDLYDHIVQIMDTTETLRDILSSMLDIYLSSISNRMNEIMKVLTIISTVFIPLSFIVGLYGMNLKNIPEYNWPGMYPTVWAIMIAIAVFMLAYFKKKKWW